MDCKKGVSGFMILNSYDLMRICECYTCPYFDRCRKEVSDPEDDTDGKCKTKKKYQGYRDTR